MNVPALARKVRRVYRQGGVRGVCRRLLAGATALRGARAVDEFDRLHGTDTSGIVPLWRLQVPSARADHGERYEATPPRELAAAVAALRTDPASLCFIDLGCGKGRTLLVAHALGFRRVLGIEFAPELARTAARNIVLAGTDGVSVLEADAADFVFPAEPSLLYLYNPFDEVVMRAVLDSIERTAAPVRFLVYKRPRFAELIDAAGFERVGHPPGMPQILIWRRVAGTAVPESTSSPVRGAEAAP